MKAKIAKKLCKYYSAINKTLLKPVKMREEEFQYFPLRLKINILKGKYIFP